MSEQHPQRRTARIVALIIAVIGLGFLIPMPAAAPTGALAGAGFQPVRTDPVTEHVVVISIDGLRPDAIEAFGATQMLRLMRQGRHTLQARTVLPSHTIPSHTSLVTGVEPDVHGVTWNDRTSVLMALLHWSDRRRRVPTIFDFAHEAGLSSAAVMAKSQMRQLTEPGAPDHLEAPVFPFAHVKREWSAERVVTEVEAYLVGGSGRPNLFFVHLTDPDRAGHDHGWMSQEYGAAVREADRAVAGILAAADAAFGSNGYTVILTSDHGGLGHGHGGADPREVTIPWIIVGRGVTPAGELDEPIRITDTAATALWLLGLQPPGYLSGRRVGFLRAGATGVRR